MKNIQMNNFVVYKVSMWMYVIIILFYIMCFGLIIASIGKNSFYFSSTICLIFLLFALFGHIKYLKTKVIIDNENIKYITGIFKKKILEIPLRSIQMVYVANRLIVIEDGEKPHKIIPYIFKDSYSIVEQLDIWERANKPDPFVNNK